MQLRAERVDISVDITALDMERLGKLCHGTRKCLQILVITDHAIYNIVDQPKRLKAQILPCFHYIGNKPAIIK